MHIPKERPAVLLPADIGRLANSSSHPGSITQRSVRNPVRSRMEFCSLTAEWDSASPLLGAHGACHASQLMPNLVPSCPPSPTCLPPSLQPWCMPVKQGYFQSPILASKISPSSYTALAVLQFNKRHRLPPMCLSTTTDFIQQCCEFTSMSMMKSWATIPHSRVQVADGRFHNCWARGLR